MSTGEGIAPDSRLPFDSPVRADRKARRPSVNPDPPIWVLLLSAALVTVPAGLLAARGSFDGLYGQDSFAYYDYAVGPLRESVRNLAPPPPFFWPPGYPLLVALTSLILAPSPLAGQLVSLAAAGLVPVFGAWLAWELWAAVYPDRRARFNERQMVALLAGIAIALAPQLWQSGIVVMADTTGLAAATLGFAAVARYGRTHWSPWLALAAAGLAFALETRWIYGLAALPGAAYALLVLTRLAPRRTAWGHALPALGLGGIILLPLLVPLLGQATVEGDVPAFTGNFQIYSWQPIRAFQREFVTADGLLQYSLPNGIYYLLLPAHRFYLTPLVAVFALPGIWFCARRRAAAPLLLLGGWAAIVYFFQAGVPWQNFRFALAYLPPLAILAAFGAVGLWRGTGRWTRVAIAAVLLAGFALQAVSGIELTRNFIVQKNQHLAIVDLAEGAIPPAGRLLTFGLTLTFRHYAPLETLELWELTPADLAALTADGRPEYLLLDVPGVERQWQRRSPYENYVWLRDGPGLTPLGEMGGYTLFRVGASLP